MVNLVSRQFENLKEVKRGKQKERGMERQREGERETAHILKEEASIKNWMKRNIEASTELTPYPRSGLGAFCV